MAYYPSVDDKEILLLLKKESTMDKGFRLLVEKYQKRLYYHVRNLVGEHEDADDVLQNVFIKVFKNIGGFEERAELFTWLYRIATNESYTFLQSQKRKATLTIDITELNSKEADNYFDELQLEEKLTKAIERLPEKQKAVFNLRYYEEMSYEDISSVLGTSVGALKASYHHAVKKVEDFIKGIEYY